MGDRPLQRFTPSAWGRRVGLTPRQVRYAITRGELERLSLPLDGRVEVTPSGRYLIVVPVTGPLLDRGVALYARVWSDESATAMEHQVQVLQSWAVTQELDVITTVREVCGPFEMPERLLTLVIDTSIPVIAVADKDVLGWLNAPFLTAILEAQARQLIDLGWHNGAPREACAGLESLFSFGQRLLDDVRRRWEMYLPPDPLPDTPHRYPPG